MAIGVGDLAPDFTLPSQLEQAIRPSEYRGKKNVILAFFPLAWTPVGSDQIPSYQAALDRFEGMETQVLGLSVDSVPSLKAWADSLGGITYPLLSDFYPHGQVAELFGVLRADGRTERAIFIIDKRGRIRYMDIHDIDKLPNNDDLFEALGAIEPDLARKAATAKATAGPQPEPKAEVLLYCTTWCPDCRRARAYLQEHQIAYAEIDIARDREAAAKVRGWAYGNETTPTFNIKGTVIVGFDRLKLDAVLGVRG
jgi:peroxiredoxin/glutaredoxin